MITINFHIMIKAISENDEIIIIIRFLIQNFFINQ